MQKQEKGFLTQSSRLLHSSTQKDLDTVSHAPSEAYQGTTPIAASQKSLTRPASAMIFSGGSKGVLKKHKQ